MNNNKKNGKTKKKKKKLLQVQQNWIELWNGEIPPLHAKRATQENWMTAPDNICYLCVIVKLFMTSF